MFQNAELCHLLGSLKKLLLSESHCAQSLSWDKHNFFLNFAKENALPSPQTAFECSEQHQNMAEDALQAGVKNEKL